MTPMSREILSISEAARLVNVSDATMRRWIRQGLFAGGNGAGRIDGAELRRWAKRHDLAIGPRPRPATPPRDLLSEAVERGAVIRDVEPASAAEAITLAIEALPCLSEETRGPLRTAILERERMASTGLGHGVAVPHPRKTPRDLFEQPVISACFPRRPLDWAALDGEPVHAVLLLLSPSAPVHLEILSRVAFALRAPEFPERLRERPNQAELVALLRSIRKDP